MKKEDMCLSVFLWKPLCKAHQPQNLDITKPGKTLRLTSLFSAIFISLFTCCSVSIYPWCRLLLGRNDHFQQQSLRIRATCHNGPVTTNDYQCIWAGCQWTGLGTAGGAEEEIVESGRVGGGCMLQGDRGLTHQWQHQNLISHPFSQQSPLHIMCQEMKSICFERLTLILYVWRLAETGVRESNIPTERGGPAETWGSSDSSNSQTLFSPPPVCSFCITKVTGVAKTLLCIYLGTKIKTKTQHPHK